MRTYLASLFVLVAACSSSSSQPPPDTASDAATVDPTAGTCTPAPNATGNSKHVGAYCTQGQGQCSQYDSALVQCSIDLDPQGSNFCILLGCSANTDCGEDACCTGRPGVSEHACVPIDCVADAGVCPAVP